MSGARFLVGDVHERMNELPDGSYDLIITSPPFLALRSYLPDGHPLKHLEIGSEATPAAFLDVMLALTAEWGRLLAPHGSIAIEIGDTYSGSGGAGGDYADDGLRDGQAKFRQKHSDAWPMAKSLAMIPELYAASLAYGRNLLTGEDSPAGRWRVRNFKPWIRSNPPVGALGDKERPATSYVTVATRATNRYFDLDAVRTAVTKPQARYVRENEQYDSTSNRGTMKPYDAAQSAGAPPLDWWHQVDAIIDAEIDRRAGKAAPGGNGAGRHRKMHGGADSGGEIEGAAQTIGARGVHIRRALERGGILRTVDALDVSPKGYKGAHYAVWPMELVKLLVQEMCPHRVCTTCGQPSRRIVAPFTLDSYRSSSRPQTRKAVALADEHGLTDDHIAAIRAFGTSDAGKATTLNNGAGKNSDHVKTLAAEAKAALGGYFREFVQTTTAERSSTWSDCGHGGTWRPGRILDPFAGSGTTLAVATGLGMHADGIDIDERNADLATERIGMFVTVDYGAPTEVAS